jgi:sigma-70-like protein
LNRADLRGADLRGADLAGVLWSSETLWPGDMGSLMRARSEELQAGVWQVAGPGASGEAASPVPERRPGAGSSEEAQLVAQTAGGNIEEPMKELYRRYAKDLYRFGLHMLGDGGLAEEMVQETFQRLWRSAGRYEAGRGSVGAFLFVIARSAAADIRNRPSSRPLPAAGDGRLPPLPPAPISSSVPSPCARLSRS